MKAHFSFLNLAFFTLLIMIIGCSKENLLDQEVHYPADAVDSGLEYRTSVTPVSISPWQAGDAAFECAQAGSSCGFSWKVDNSGTNGTYHTNTSLYGNTPTVFDASIVIYNSNGQSFSWSSDYKLCAVIVKGGPAANIYYYPDGSCGDIGLTPPINPNSGQPYDISHLTFCFDDSPCDDPIPNCYQEETAWAEGPRFKKRGNWATYTPFPGDGATVDIFAGQTMFAGTVLFTDQNDGTVDLTINLDNGFIFYYDLDDVQADDNVKIQDYTNAPSGNPAPGQFDHKDVVDAGETSFTINVPLNNFYGIHLDVAYEIACD